MDPKVETRKKPFRLLRWARIAVGLSALWLTADFGYFCFVSWRHRIWEQSQLRDARGVLAECEEFSVGTGTDALLLVHGINSSPYAWRKMAPRLAAGGFHVHVLRLPGFAEPVREYGRYSVEDWLAKVESEIARLRAQHRRVLIVAQSLGGAITLRHILDHPDSVDGVALLSPAIEVSNRRSPLLPTRFWHQVCQGLVFTTLVTSSFDNDARDPAEIDSSHETLFTPRRVIDQTFELVDANRGHAPEIKIPLIMFLSQGDNVIDWQAAESYFHQVGSVRKQLTFNDQAGHPLSFDYGWEKIADEIVAFFQAE